METRNAVVIVTGASSGLGEATARLFAQQGATVALAARSQEVVQRLADNLSGAIAAPVDVRDPRSVDQMVAHIHDRCGRIDALINVAGQGMHGFLEQVEVAQYRLLMDVNLYGPLLMMQAVVPIMRQQGGGLVLNVSAPLGRMPFIPSLGAYASTKAALTVMTLTARAELAREHIRVGIFCPGMMATAMDEHLLPASTHHPVAAAWEAGAELPPGAPQREAPSEVAASLLDAFQREDAEYFTPGFLWLEIWMKKLSASSFEE